MAQTAVITMQDNGVSNALSGILETIRSIANTADSLSKISKAVGNLRDKNTLLGQTFNKVKETLLTLNVSLKAKSLSLGKVGLAIAAVIAIVIGLIAWWRDLGDRNSELKDQLVGIWNSIRDVFYQLMPRALKSAIASGSSSPARNILAISGI